MSTTTRQKTQDAIDALRSTLKGCDLVLLADWETGMVLCKDSDTSLRQDAIDDIAKNARADLETPWVTAMADTAKTVTSTRISAASWTVGLKRTDGDEMLVCRYSGLSDQNAMHNAANAVFDVLSPAQETPA